MFANWNDPFIEIVAQSLETVGRRIEIIDVGAGIGDTVLLIEANCPQAVERYLCIEGDPQFHRLCEYNLSHMSNVSSICAMLSAKSESVGALIRNHAGTASAKGNKATQATTLDSLFGYSNLVGVDVLKIDVDGFDGKVLAGSRRILSAQQPAVIFEWHPIACIDTDNDPIAHFNILSEHNYNCFVWFDKFGLFSHFSKFPDKWSIESLIQVATNKRHDPDWHYDVIALGSRSRIDPVRLAELPYAKQRRSWY